MRIFISLSLKVINRKIFHINNCNIFALRWAGNIQYWLFCWKNLFYYTSTSQTDRLSRLWSPMNFIFCKPIQLPVQTRCYRCIRAAAELIFEMKNRQHKSRRMKSNYSKFVVKHQRCQCEERVSERVGNWTQKKWTKTTAKRCECQVKSNESNPNRRRLSSPRAERPEPRLRVLSRGFLCHVFMLSTAIT